jgi:PKD repeat protein
MRYLVWPILSILLSLEASAGLTPLEQAGLVPCWKETLRQGKIGTTMQFYRCWEKDSTQKICPHTGDGYVFLGTRPDPASHSIEMLWNKFRERPDEQHNKVIEFDMRLVGTSHSLLLSLRPFLGAYAGSAIGINGSSSYVVFTGSYDYDGSPTGTDPIGRPIGKKRYRRPQDKALFVDRWVHVVLSFRQYLDSEGIMVFHRILAVNEDLYECLGRAHGDNRMLESHWGYEQSWCDGFGFGYELTHRANSEEGVWLANFRGYPDFMDRASLQAALDGRTAAWCNGISDPVVNQYTRYFIENGKTPPEFRTYSRCFADVVGRLTALFDGSWSSSYEQIDSFEWDFGDGQTGCGRQVRHRYANPGTYIAALTVRAKGIPSSSWETNTLSVTVSDTAPEPPEACIQADLVRGVVPFQVLFDGRGSRKAGGTIVSYEWDFGDSGTGKGERVRHTYTARGSHKVVLEVTDNEGYTDTETVTIFAEYPGGTEVFSLRNEKTRYEEYHGYSDFGSISWSPGGLAGTNGKIGIALKDAEVRYGQRYFYLCEDSFKLSCWVNLDSMSMADGDRFTIFRIDVGRPSGTPDTYLLRGDVLCAAGRKRVKVAVRDDNPADHWTPASYALASGENKIEMEVNRASSPTERDGRMVIWLNGVRVAEVRGVNLYELWPYMTKLRIGAVSGLDAGTSGTIYLDEVVLAIPDSP